METDIVKVKPCQVPHSPVGFPRPILDNRRLTLNSPGSQKKTQWPSGKRKEHGAGKHRKEQGIVIS